MVYTLTLNPCLDYIIRLNEFKSGGTNRAEETEIYPGGKGINVSIVLERLGVENIALGFAAGFTGDAICRCLNDIGIKSDFIRLPEGLSRINVKLKTDTETEINAKGPNIDKKSIELLYQKIDKIKSGDFLILSGSIPNGASENIYRDVLKRVKNVRTVVDTFGKPLLNTLEYRPFLIKPNIDELSQLFKKDINTLDEVVSYAEELKKQGAVNVIVSMGGGGAVLIDENNALHRLKAPKGNVVNTVGSGDCMVAGFVSGIIEGMDYADAFRLGAAAGSAGAFSAYLPLREDITNLFNKL